MYDYRISLFTEGLTTPGEQEDYKVEVLLEAEVSRNLKPVSE